MGIFHKDRLPDTRSYLESQGLKAIGKGEWVTTECRFHGGKETMRWNTSTGGWICMSCGVKGGDVLAYHMGVMGLPFVTAARELGAWEDDGTRPTTPYKAKPLPAGEALKVLAFEALLVTVAASNVANGVELTDADRERLKVAAKRIAVIQEAYA